MSRDKRGQNPEEFALANLKPVLARFPILTIKYPRSVFLTPKRETSGVASISTRRFGGSNSSTILTIKSRGLGSCMGNSHILEGGTE